MKQIWRLKLLLSPFVVFFFSTPLHALDLRAGGTIGYGGAGLIKSVDVNGTQVSVNRAEGPGVFSIFIDDLISDSWTIGLEHSRGFRLGPFSSGEGFTGFTARWYFNGPVPSMVAAKEGGSTLLVKRYTMFVGTCFGVADASISREDDQVRNVTAEGVYSGIKFGVDKALGAGYGSRIEMIYSQTLMSTGPVPTYLTEFALQFGLYFAF